MDYVQRIEQLKTFDRAKLFEIYMDYVIRMAAMKHNFQIVERGTKGWGEPDKVTGNYGLHYLWKHYVIESFDDFVSEKNISIVDLGEDWEKQRYAQRVRTEYHGIFRWYAINQHLHVN